MGFNPQAPRDRTRHPAWDYLFVGAAILICAAVVLWALLG